MLQIRVERHRCIGAGNCISIAPTAFDWLKGEFAKAEVVDPESIEEELLREAALSCPTQAIIIEETEELLPWQLRQVHTSETQRVLKTFMFTDMVKSTTLVEALGDEAWEVLLSWHHDTLRSLFAAHHGEEVEERGDGFFVIFDSPEAALGCAVAIQRKLSEHRRANGFAPQVRIGIHASDATQVGVKFSGRGVHEAARIAAQAESGEILASSRTTAGTRLPVSEPHMITMKGLSEPLEVVSVKWR